MEIRAITWEGMEWIHLAVDEGKWPDFVITVMKLRGPQNAENCLTS